MKAWNFYLNDELVVTIKESQIKSGKDGFEEATQLALDTIKFNLSVEETTV